MRRLLVCLGAMVCVASTTSAAIVLNEFRPNPVGGDPATDEFVELRATAGEIRFDGFWASIEGDNTTFDVQNSGSVSVQFDANGLAIFDTGDIENPAFTFVLSTVDNSAAQDIAGFQGVIDALGIPDQPTGDTLFGATLGFTDFAYTGDEPQSVFRDSITLDWFAVNDPAGTNAFDVNGNPIAGSQFDVDPTTTPSTFGAINPTAVPEPSSIACLAVLGAGGIYRRVRRKKTV